MGRVFTRIKQTSAQKAAVSKDKQILDKVNRFLSEGASWCQPIHDRCEENQAYVGGGTQWSEGDVMKQELRDRPHMPMNKIIQVVNAIANKEIVQRYVPKVYGRSEEDNGIAKAFDEFIRWQRDMAESEHEDSMAFRSMITSGYGCLHKYFDPLENGGKGQIVDEEVPIWWMLWDSRARKQNLSDRRWHLQGRYVSVDEAREEFTSPEAVAMFKKLDSATSNFDLPPTGGDRGRWPWETIAGGKWFNRADNEIFLIEVEWKDIKTVYSAAVPDRLEEFASLQNDPTFQVDLNSLQPGMDAVSPDQQQQNMISGDSYFNMSEEEQFQIKQLFLSQTSMKMMETDEYKIFEQKYLEIVGESFKDFVKQKKYVYNYAVVSADTILDTGERKSGFTFEFLTGFPLNTRDGTTHFGFVDVAKGPQDWRNTFLSLALTRLAHSPKQTILIEETAVDDADEFFDQMANPRGAAVVPDGFVSGNRFLLLQPPTFPPMERELIAMADQAISELAGLSGIDLGQQGDLRRISGTVVSSVKDASNTILALLFDSLRRYRKRSGKMIICFMYEFYSPQEVARIIGAKYAAELRSQEEWPDAELFDIKIDEAPMSATDKMEFFDVMTRTDALKRWEDRIPFDLLIEWIPWVSDSDKARIKEFNDQQDQTKQTQQQLEQAQADLLGILQVLQSEPNGDQIIQKFAGIQQMKNASAAVDPNVDAQPQQGGEQGAQGTPDQQ